MEALDDDARPHENTVFDSLTADVTIEADGAAVITVAGEIDIATGDIVRTAVATAIEHSPARLVFDMAAVDFMDSSGIAVLNTTRTDAEERGIGFSLVAVPPQAIRVLELTGMTSLFQLNGDDHRDRA